MLTLNVRCLIQGKCFSPALVEKAGGLSFRQQEEPGSIGTAGRYRGKPLPYGSAVLALSKAQSVDPRKSLDLLVETLRPSIKYLRKEGADNIVLHCDIFFENQCNFELSAEQIAAVAELHIPMTISCYEKKDFPDS
jgi:hypothetical protein